VVDGFPDGLQNGNGGVAAAALLDRDGCFRWRHFNADFCWQAWAAEGDCEGE
jgi:hypothetical protein